MTELSEKVAKKQFNKFARAYKKCRGINLIWVDHNKNAEGGWDFKGKDEKGRIVPIEYTEGMINQKMKAQLEACKRGEYNFNFAIKNKFAHEVIKEAYNKKLTKTDKNTILLIGFHDIFYAEENSKFDGLEIIRTSMKKEFRENLFKEVWMINLADERCYLIF